MSTPYSVQPFIKSSNLCHTLNVLGLSGISMVLLAAFYYQFAEHELPCPLCLLQRVGLLSIGLGFLMNIRFGSKPLHYGLAILSALLSGAISVRQILLHIIPGSGSYGSSFLGMHFYTWGLLIACAAIAFIALLLILESFTENAETPSKISVMAKIVITAFTFLVGANLLFVFLECGIGQCASDPTTYQMLQNI